MIELTPAVKLALGGRYERYRFGFRLARFGQHDFRDSSFSPNIGVVWAASAAHNLYASFSRSFSPLGGNGYLNTQPQYNRQIEAGIKSDWLGGRLSSTVSIYQIAKHNIRYQPDPTHDPDHYEIAGQHRTRGVDASLTGHLTRQWHVRASIGLMSPKVVEDASNRAREGRYLGNASRRQIGLTARYVAPASQWFAEVSAVHTGKRYPNPPASYLTATPGYTRLDALLGWRFAPNVQAVLAVQT